VRSRGKVEPVFVPGIENIAGALAAVIRDGDLVVTMGAGHIGAMAHELPAKLMAAVGKTAPLPRRRAGDRP
jgi:UDP-N-acetylmuramate--alanine ligase